MSTYFVYTLHCQPAAAHRVLHHFRCGWPLVELPAGAASLQSPVALLAALEPICISTDHFSKMQMWEGTQKKMVHLAGSQDRQSQEIRTLHKYPLVCMHALDKLGICVSLQVGAANHLRQLSLKQIPGLMRSRWCSSSFMFSGCQRHLIKIACAFCVPCLQLLTVRLQDNNLLCSKRCC